MAQLEVRRQLVHNPVESTLRNRARLIDYANRSLCFTNAARFAHDLDHSLLRTLLSARGTLVAATYHDCTRTISTRLDTFLSYSEPIIATYALQWGRQVEVIVNLLLIKEHEEVSLN